MSANNTAHFLEFRNYGETDAELKETIHKENEFMIDTAAGSCGFPVHTIFHVWKKFGDSELFTAENKPPQFAEYVQEKIFAIDFDEKAVRVARTLNLIAGDVKEM